MPQTARDISSTASLAASFQRLLGELADRRIELEDHLNENAPLTTQFIFGEIKENRMISYMVDNILTEHRKIRPIVISDEEE